MNTCTKCHALEYADESIDTGVRWSLTDETQRVTWDTQPDAPEVDIPNAVELGAFCCREHAFEALHSVLAQVNATLQWADIGPIEKCACCGADIDTTQCHHVLTLLVEKGPLAELTYLDGGYAARFCTDCKPVGSLVVPA